MTRRLVPILAWLVAATLMPAAAFGQTPGDQGAPSAPRRVGVGNHSSHVRGWTETHGQYGRGRRGTEEVTFHGEGGAGPSNGGSGPTGPEACGEGPLVIPPWAESAPSFRIETLPRQQGVVNVESRFMLDGEFDGHAFWRRAPAQVTHTEPTYVDGEFTGCGVAYVETVYVRAHYWPISYQWDYGDGERSSLIACGSLAAGPSDCLFGVRQTEDRISHLYEVSSAEHADQGGYLLGVTVMFGMGISADNDGAPVIPLLQVPDRGWLRYQVREVQSILTR